ncbi:hypothetical protein EW145_g329 [Phellinidium pouzarii]|uniref:F-box domain-containing protein n=1 Tax=Phellinidium pouzarii TaxID=167371 RepID=A0A4S4LJA6_9AGAM|nr:hypothetical protein EW145_g329 [Phellinidium pouzarii]
MPPSRNNYALFEALPVELIAEILSALDLATLITVSCLSRRLREISSDTALNPWKGPIAHNLRNKDGEYESCLAHLTARTPRANWVDILSAARAEFILFSASIPSLPDSDYDECFRRRFLPSWTKWKKDGRWKEAFLKVLYRVWHRSVTSCTADEAWTKYIVLNRNGSANLLEATSRTFNPLHLFNEMKIQNNLAHLETHIRLVVELADVRILALGVLCKPRSTFSINENARVLLHPPGIQRDDEVSASLTSRVSVDEKMGVLSRDSNHFNSPLINSEYTLMTHPQPSPRHINYPLYTPGGEDVRWTGAGLLEEQGNFWVGVQLLTAQLVTPQTRTHSGELPVLQDLDLVLGPGRSHYMSFTWADLDAIAPWMRERIVKRIDGQGLGI